MEDQLLNVVLKLSAADGQGGDNGGKSQEHTDASSQSKFTAISLSGSWVVLSPSHCRALCEHSGGRCLALAPPLLPEHLPSTAAHKFVFIDLYFDQIHAKAVIGRC